MSSAKLEPPEGKLRFTLDLDVVRLSDLVENKVREAVQEEAITADVAFRREVQTVLKVLIEEAVRKIWTEQYVTRIKAIVEAEAHKTIKRTIARRLLGEEDKS